MSAYQRNMQGLTRSRSSEGLRNVPCKGLITRSYRRLQHTPLLPGGNLKTKTDHLVYLLLFIPLPIGMLIDQTSLCPTPIKNSLKRVREAGLVHRSLEHGRLVYISVQAVS